MARLPEIIRRGNISQVAATPKPAGAGWAALAQLAKIGEDFVRPKALEQARDEGFDSVYRDANGALQVEEKSVLSGELGDAHNTAAFAKYLSQRKIDMSLTYTELAQRFEFDPAGFKQASDGYVKLLQEDEKVPRALKEELLLDANREAGVRFNGLYRNATVRTQREADTNTKIHRDMLVDDYVSLYASGDIKAAEEKLREIEGVSGFRSAASYIAETDMETAAYMRGIRGAAKVAKISRDLTSGNITPEQAVEAMKPLLADPDLTTDQQQKLYEMTQGRLKAIDARAITEVLTDPSFSGRAARAAGAAPSSTTVEYAMGPNRPDAPNPEIINVITASAEQTFGPGARIVVTSGQEGDKPQFGSNRHITGHAADFAIYRPDGTQVRANDPDMKLFAKAAARNGALGIGFGSEYMGDNVHIDKVKPGKGQGHFWGSGASSIGEELVAIMQGSQIVSDATRAKNQEALKTAGINVTEGAEFLAATFGMTTAISVMSAAEGGMAVDYVDEKMLTRFPELRGMSAADVRVWAERKMTVKASDIAKLRPFIDRIPDEEVRALAERDLIDRYNVQKRSEDARLATYQERLSASDDTLTAREVMSDHGISDEAQREIVRTMKTIRDNQSEAQKMTARLADENGTFDVTDAGERKGISAAFGQMMDGKPVLSEEGMVTAGAITLRTGYIPSQMFSAIHGAVLGGDPAVLATSMEFLNQVNERQRAAMNISGTTDERKAVLDAMSDYRFFASMMGATEAAARVQELHSPEVQDRLKNLTDEAKKSAKELKPEDIANHFAAGNIDVYIPDAVQPVLMAEYTRLYEKAFLTTGDVGLARNRALSDIARVWGPESVTGNDHLMKFPPQNFVPSPPGAPAGWMGDALYRDVYELVVGEAPELGEAFLDETASSLVRAIPGLGGMIKPVDVPIQSIHIRATVETAADIARGANPGYAVWYQDRDGNLQTLPGRYFFENAPDQTQEQQQKFNRVRDLASERRTSVAAQEDFNENVGAQNMPVPPSIGSGPR
jgi:hypothetical protein